MSGKVCEYPPCSHAATTSVTISIKGRVCVFRLCQIHAVRAAAFIARQGGQVEDRRRAGRRP